MRPKRGQKPNLGRFQRLGAPEDRMQTGGGNVERGDAIFTHADTYTSHGDITDADGKPKVIEVTYYRVK